MKSAYLTDVLNQAIAMKRELMHYIYRASQLKGMLTVKDGSVSEQEVIKFHEMARLLMKPKCDCGGEKARTTHSHWCSYTTTRR